MPRQILVISSSGDVEYAARQDTSSAVILPARAWAMSDATLKVLMSAAAPSASLQRCSITLEPKGPLRREGHAVQDLIATYGLLAVLVLMAAESACIPVPSEVTMLFAGALAAGAESGPHPSLAAVILAGTLGNVVGSYLAWLMGKHGGRSGLRRWGRYVGVRPREIDKAQDWFDRCGASAVFWSRLLPGIRTFISLPAGIAEMSPVRFGLYTAAGCLPWTAGLAIVGYGIGANWQRAERALHGPSLAIAVVVSMAIGIWVLLAIRRSRRESAGEAVSSMDLRTNVDARDGS